MDETWGILREIKLYDAAVDLILREEAILRSCETVNEVTAEDAAELDQIQRDFDHILTQY